MLHGTKMDGHTVRSENSGNAAGDFSHIGQNWE